MHTLRQQIQVRFDYAVHFTRHLFAPENPLFEDVIREGSSHGSGKALFVVDAGVAEHNPRLLPGLSDYLAARPQTLRAVGEPILMEGGERVKNDPANLDRLHRAVHDAGLDRHAYVAVIGGGALLDLAGYAAATAHRGIRLLRIPSTTLSQADSGVGVKNSMNAFGKKNFLGTFAPPFAVFNDFALLDTLPMREWRGGIAEAVKVALIKDADFFGYLEANAPALAGRSTPVMEALVHRCAAMHLRHIATAGDPFETGSSRPLDFGHWAAHKLEQLSDYRLRHGEAVAIGIALDATYSHLAGFLPEADWRRTLALLSAVGFDLFAPELGRHLEDLEHPDNILHGLSEFREHLGGRLTIMLLEGIGHGFEVHDMDEGRVRESIAALERAAAELRSPAGVSLGAVACRTTGEYSKGSS